jgi:voltage-gated potassium channel
MGGLRRLLIPILGLAAITGLGTAGYVLVEGLSWLDAAYMTVITMSTVGYGEIVPLHPAGKLFTMALIMGTVGFALYLFTDIANALLHTNLRDLFRGKDMQTRIAGLSNHVIVCGYGRFGRIVVEELDRAGVPTVVIESDPGRQAELDTDGALYLIGSAASDEMLVAAGIERARAIAIGTGSDPDNVFITLSAREHNREIRIHARGESDAAMRRLTLAGANQVVSAYHMGGRAIASSILRPAVVDFLEIARPKWGEEVDLEELRLGEGCALAGRTIEALEAEVQRLRVVALKRGEEAIHLVPGADTEVRPGDHLVVIGERESLTRIAQLSVA